MRKEKAKRRSESGEKREKGKGEDFASRAVVSFDLSCQCGAILRELTQRQKASNFSHILGKTFADVLVCFADSYRSCGLYAAAAGGFFCIAGAIALLAVRKRTANV